MLVKFLPSSGAASEHLKQNRNNSINSICIFLPRDFNAHAKNNRWEKGGSLHDKKSLEYQEKSNIRNIEYTSLLTRGANRANALPISQKKCPPTPTGKNPNNAKYVSFGLFWMLRSPRVIKPSPGVTVGGNERKKTRERLGNFFYTFTLVLVFSDREPWITKIPLESCVLYKSSRKLTSVRILKGENF